MLVLLVAVGRSQRSLEGLLEGPHGDAGRDADGAEQEEEHLLRHVVVEGADGTREVVAEEARGEPEAHHHGDDACR